MQVELLIRVTDNFVSESDPDEDRRRSYKKGYFVSYKEYPHNGWGAKEGLPDFVIVRCNDVSQEEITAWLRRWHRDILYEPISVDHINAIYQYKVIGDNVSPTGENILTPDQVVNFLLRWGASVDLIEPNEVTYTASLWDAVRSPGFWGRDVSDVAFNLVSYDPGPGIGIIDATVPATWPHTKVENYILQRDGNVVGWADNTVRFQIDRVDVFEWFKREVRIAVDNIEYSTYRRKRFYFNEADVDYVVEQGGFIELTRTQLLNRVKDPVHGD